MRTFLLAGLLPLVFPAQDPKALSKSAEEKMRAGDWKSAAADLTRAIEADGARSHPFYLRGSCKIALGDYEGATADFTAAMDRGDRKPRVYVSRGMSRFLGGDPKGAIGDLSEGPEDPKDGDTLLFRANAYYAVDAWDNALRDFLAVSRADGSKADSLRCMIWLARAHAGEREAATRDLHSQPPQGWMGHVASYLEGTISEENLLRDASLEPEASRANAQAAAWYFLGSKRRLDGKEDPEAFRKALKSSSGSASFDAAARAQLDSWAARDRRRILDVQEERFRALKRFHAEFRFRALSEKGEEVNKDDEFTFSLDFDRENERLCASVAKGSALFPEGMRMLFDKKVLTAWKGEDQAQQMNYSALFDSIDHWDSRALAELDRLVPPDPGTAHAAAPREFMFLLFLEGKPGRDEQGAVRFAVGRGSYPCSWTRDGTSNREATVREEGDEVVMEFPSKGKRIVLDQATGFPKLVEARDYDGKRRQFLRTAFSRDGAFPLPKLPEKTALLPLNDAIEKMWSENQSSTLSLRLEEAVVRWDKIRRAGKEPEVKRLFVGWLSYYLGTLWEFNVHRSARQYIQWALNQGQKMTDLEKDADEHIKAYKLWAAQGRKALEAFLRGQLDDLARRLTTELIEEPIDSRLHSVLRQLRNELFDFDAIEAERGTGDDSKTDRIFREELAAARQL